MFLKFYLVVVAAVAALVSLVWSGDVFCDNDYNMSSCANSTLDEDKTYLCRGFMSCKDSTIDTDNNLYCQGDRSCKNVVYESGDESLYSYGYRSADSLVMSSESQAALCYGYQSCLDIVYAQEDDNWNYAYSYGYQAMYGGYIDYAPWIYSYGYQSLYETTINTSSLTSDILYVYLDGFHASYDTDIICQDGQTCNIYARGWYATEETYLYCLAGSICNVECGDTNGCDGLTMYCFSTSSCYFNCSTATSCPYEEDASEDTIMKLSISMTTIADIDSKFYQILETRMENKLVKQHKFKEEREREEKLLYGEHNNNNNNMGRMANASSFIGNNQLLFGMVFGTIIGASLVIAIQVCMNQYIGKYKYQALA